MKNNLKKLEILTIGANCTEKHVTSLQSSLENFACLEYFYFRHDDKFGGEIAKLRSFLSTKLKLTAEREDSTWTVYKKK